LNPFRPQRSSAAVPPEGPAHAAEGADVPVPDERELRIAELEAELARAKDGWLRAEAELQNARRRASREVDEKARRAEEEALLLVLPFVDDLERALEAADRAGEADTPLAQGVALVLSRLLDALARSGAVALDPMGQPFDPQEHEALLTAESHEHAPGVVAQVIARGFKLRDRLLRPAKVVVSSGAKGKARATGDGGTAADPGKGS